MTRVILPCKDFLRAKSRLAGVLASHERRNLMQAMVEDVLQIVSRHPSIDEVVLVSDDPSAELLAAKYGVRHLDEASLKASGLNGVVTATCLLLEQESDASILVLHGDVPALENADIDAVITAVMEDHVELVLVPDRTRNGTNGLMYTSGTQLTFCYGDNSFSQHQTQASAPKVLDLPGLSLDIDDPQDLYELLGYLQEHPQAAPHTRKLLLGTAIGSRVETIVGGAAQSSEIQIEDIG